MPITSCNVCPCFDVTETRNYGEICHFVRCSYDSKHLLLPVDKEFDQSTEMPKDCPLPTRCRPTRFYVASSWRNERQPEVVKVLQEAGHDVYDFRNPAEGDPGFGFHRLDPDWQQWPAAKFREMLNDEYAEASYQKDLAGMENADAFVLLMPCGRSAHLEAGWAVGKGLPVAILLDDESEPELMYKLANRLVVNMDELLEWAAKV